MSKKKNRHYLMPDSLNIQSHIAMLPCGGLDDDATHIWTCHDLLPYTSYLCEDKAIDRMFSGFIFNGICTRENHYIYPLYASFGKPANHIDWSEWINILFKKNVNLCALSEAAGSVPVDVWISMPYPHPFQEQFGIVTGIRLNFKNEQHRIAAVQWWLDKFLTMWSKRIDLHHNLRLQGFVWQRESIDEHDKNVVTKTNAFLQSKGFLSMWLPNFGSYGVHHYKELKFDITAINPNYYGNTSYNYAIINRASRFARKYRTGMQINYGKGLVYNDTHLLDYFNLGLHQYNDYMNKSLLIYQFPNQRLREVYEDELVNYIRLYLFIKGLYKRIDYPGINY